MYTYADLQDRADFDGVAALFAHGVFQRGDGKEFRGQEIAEHRKRVNVVHDGGLGTRHVTSNVTIEVDEEHDTATADSYYMVVQGTASMPLQVIVAGRYHDRFDRVDGEWRFTHRRSFTDLYGRMDEHRRD
jgi:hypothetical protein